jgi:kynurenine formamidase
MCEPVTSKVTGWQGWRDLPAPEALRADGPWLDLSHPITTELSRAPSFPRPRIRQIATIPHDPANVTEVHMVVHHGTHLDAPRHFIADGPTFDQIPLERLYGTGEVWRIPAPDYGLIEPADLERATPRMRPGDIVFLDTGRARHVTTEAYEEHAALTPAAAAWLVEQDAKIVGVDFSTPDLAAHRRPAGFDWPVHHALLGHGVLIAEHMTNLEALAGRRVEVMFLGLNVVGSDGAPARVIARPVA